MQAVDGRATEKQFGRKLGINRRKTTFTILWKSDKIFLRTFFKMLCTLWWNGSTVNKYLGIFFLIGIGVTHIPIYLNCHSFPFPFLSWYLFPFLWYSREIPIASPILAVISITDAARIVCRQHIRVTVGWRLSVGLSVPSIDSSSGARRVYC